MRGPDPIGVSLDAALALLVRDEVQEALRPVFATILERLDALAAAALPSLVDLEEAAKRLGKSPSTLRRLAGEGRLPGAIRVGRSWRVDLRAVRPATTEVRR
jgi:excisionase family DNA binding protein